MAGLLAPDDSSTWIQPAGRPAQRMEAGAPAMMCQVKRLRPLGLARMPCPRSVWTGPGPTLVLPGLVGGEQERQVGIWTATRAINPITPSSTSKTRRF